MRKRKHRGPYRVEPFMDKQRPVRVYQTTRIRAGWGVVPYRCRNWIEVWWEVPEDGIDSGDCYMNACRKRDQLNGVGVDGPKKERLRREWGR